MKTILFLFLLISNICFSQNLNFNLIKKTVAETYPNINFTDKLLAISIWNSEDKNSREINKEFLKTYSVYKDAKLKGGLKGVIFITISTDKNEVNFKIAQQKDLNNYEFSLCDFKSYTENSKLSKMNLNTQTQNSVFDNNGNLIYENLDLTAVFKAFNLLITR